MQRINQYSDYLVPCVTEGMMAMHSARGADTYILALRGLHAQQNSGRDEALNDCANSMLFIVFTCLAGQ